MNTKQEKLKSFSYRSLVWTRLKRHRLALGSFFILGALVMVSILAPLISKYLLGYSYQEVNLLERFLPPSREHLFGTDDLGRDLMVLIIYGGRVSLTVGFIAALTSTFIGTLIGSIAGYYGGLLDGFLMRLTDVLLSLPTLALMIILAAVDIDKLLGLAFLGRLFNPDVIKIIIIVVIFGWMSVARLVRGSVLSVREKEFIEAAKALGVRDFWIIVRHIVPNTMAPIIVAVTLQIGGVILYEAALSFLGLGIQPPLPSWGNILQRAQQYIITGKAPWLTIFPGLFIFITVISFNFLGDGLRDALDPRLKEQ